MQPFKTVDRYCGGFLGNTYVYTLMGPDGPNVFAKIGMSINLRKRLIALVHDCPGPPSFAACIAMSSEGRARQLESALHIALDRWHDRGEWFRFKPADKSAVNDASRVALRMFSSRDRPLRWLRIEVGALQADGSPPKRRPLGRL